MEELQKVSLQGTDATFLIAVSQVDAVGLILQMRKSRLQEVKSLSCQGHPAEVVGFRYYFKGSAHSRH